MMNKEVAASCYLFPFAFPRDVLAREMGRTMPSARIEDTQICVVQKWPHHRRISLTPVGVCVQDVGSGILS